MTFSHPQPSLVLGKALSNYIARDAAFELFTKPPLWLSSDHYAWKSNITYSFTQQTRMGWWIYYAINKKKNANEKEHIYSLVIDTSRSHICWHVAVSLLYSISCLGVDFTFRNAPSSSDHPCLTPLSVVPTASGPLVTVVRHFGRMKNHLRPSLYLCF